MELRRPPRRGRRHVVSDHHCLRRAIGPAAWARLRPARSPPAGSWSATSVLYFQVIVQTRPALCGWAQLPETPAQAYEAVREAQQAAIEAVRPGVTAGEVDAAARKVLRKAGLGRYFTHSTGHGVGLEIHEIPRVARGRKKSFSRGWSSRSSREYTSPANGA